MSIHIIPRFVSAPLQRVPLVHMESKRQAAARLRSPSDELPLSLFSKERSFRNLSLFLIGNVCGNLSLFDPSNATMQPCDKVEYKTDHSKDYVYSHRNIIDRIFPISQSQSLSLFFFFSFHPKNGLPCFNTVFSVLIVFAIRFFFFFS